MRHSLLLLAWLLVVGCSSAGAAKVKLSLPAGTYSARFQYDNDRGMEVASSPETVQDGDTLQVPPDARANIVLSVTDDAAGNVARIDLGRPPKEDVELRLTRDDFSWVETVEVRVTSQPDLQPVAGALVLVRREGKPEFGWVGETTADGAARIGPVPSGNVSVDVWAPNRAPSSQFITIERDRPAKVAQVDVPLPPAAATTTESSPQATPGTEAEAPVAAAPTPMKVLVGLLGLLALVFFVKLWISVRVQEHAQAGPLAPTRPSPPFGGALTGPSIVLSLISGLAGAISAGSAGGSEDATPFLLAMLAQVGFALVTVVGIRGRNDALTGFGASALAAAFLAPLALAQTWAQGSDGTRVLALVLNVIGAMLAVSILVAAVAALERGQVGPAAQAKAPSEAAAPRATCPYCGEPIDETTGACGCRPAAPTAPASQAVMGEAVLMGIRGKYAGVEFTLQADGPTRIGRDAANDVVLDDPTVSRRHAQVERTDEGIVLTDLGSSNGTFVNGSRVEQAVLRAGDEVAIGGSTFRLQIAG